MTSHVTRKMTHITACVPQDDIKMLENVFLFYININYSTSPLHKGKLKKISNFVFAWRYNT